MGGIHRIPPVMQLYLWHAIWLFFIIASFTQVGKQALVLYLSLLVVLVFHHIRFAPYEFIEDLINKFNRDALLGVTLILLAMLFTEVASMIINDNIELITYIQRFAIWAFGVWNAMLFAHIDSWLIVYRLNIKYLDEVEKTSEE